LGFELRSSYLLARLYHLSQTPVLLALVIFQMASPFFLTLASFFCDLLFVFPE
jgi:hypothetical protein